jgi:hypothetical protein
VLEIARVGIQFDEPSAETVLSLQRKLVRARSLQGYLSFLRLTRPLQELPAEHRDTARPEMLSSALKRATGLDIDKEQLRVLIDAAFRCIDREFEARRKFRYTKKYRALDSAQRAISLREIKFNASELEALKAPMFLAGNEVGRLERLLAAAPPSFEKSRSFLRALVAEREDGDPDQVLEGVALLREEVPETTVQEIASSWREEQQRSNSRSSIFWTSDDDMERYDALSRYRFQEVFSVGGFSAAFEEVEHAAQEALIEEAKTSAFTLWLVSRSRRLTGRIAHAVSLALKTVTGYLDPRGCWRSWDEMRIDSSSRPAPAGESSAWMTAISAYALVRLSETDEQADAAARAARWLLDHQGGDGCWVEDRINSRNLSGRAALLRQRARETRHRKAVESEPSLATTLVAMDVLQRTGLVDARLALSKAERWVLSRQAPSGEWLAETLPWPLETILAVEYDLSRGRPSPAKDHFLEMGVGFLRRAPRLVAEKNPASRRLAIIAAAQGLEAVLYSILQRVGRDPWLPKGQRTKGLRAALDELRDHLHSIGEVGGSETLKFSQSLTTLAYYRDEVVHKAAEISDQLARELVEDALRFAEKYGRLILGYDVLT